MAPAACPLSECAVALLLCLGWALCEGDEEGNAKSFCKTPLFWKYGQLCLKKRLLPFSPSLYLLYWRGNAPSVEALQTTWVRKLRRLQQNHSEEGETTSLIAKMKLSQSSTELAKVSLKRDKGERDFTWVCARSTHYKGLQLSAKGLAATEWAQKQF